MVNKSYFQFGNDNEMKYKYSRDHQKWNGSGDNQAAISEVTSQSLRSGGHFINMH